MELRKLRGPVLDTFYVRLRRCGNLVCTGKPFTEHNHFPVLMIDRAGKRPAWRQAPTRSARRSPLGGWYLGTRSHRCGSWRPGLGCQRRLCASR